MFTHLGYGVGFPKNSMWIPKFNEYLMRYRENGDLERMQRFWFTGACEPRKRRRTSSKPLALAQVWIILKLCNAVVKNIKPSKGMFKNYVDKTRWVGGLANFNII